MSQVTDFRMTIGTDGLTVNLSAFHKGRWTAQQWSQLRAAVRAVEAMVDDVERALVDARPDR